MSFSDFTRGSLVRYPYLWAREAEAGETEGRKSRETVVAARFQFEGRDEFALLAVTASMPSDEVATFELPETEMRRIVRGGKARLWVVLSEVNFDVIGDSFYLEPDAKVGELSPPVFRQLWSAFVEALPQMQKIRRRD